MARLSAQRLLGSDIARPGGVGGSQGGKEAQEAVQQTEEAEQKQQVLLRGGVSGRLGGENGVPAQARAVVTAANYFVIETRDVLVAFILFSHFVGCF